MCKAADARVVNAAEWEKCCKGRECEEIRRVILNPGNGGDLDNRYKRICQMYGNEDHFATLYDTQNRIPVFSLSQYQNRGTRHPRPNITEFYIEPQLENATADDNMSPEDNHTQYDNQSTNANYRNAGIYNRGHMYPAGNAMTPKGKNATFTLTNVVPQRKDLNQRCWNRVEQQIRNYANRSKCGNYSVVVGAVPGNQTLNGRVNIPSYIWSYINCSDQVALAFLLQNNVIKEVQWNQPVKVYPRIRVNDFLSNISVLHQNAHQCISRLQRQRLHTGARNFTDVDFRSLTCNRHETEFQRERFREGRQAVRSQRQNRK